MAQWIPSSCGLPCRQCIVEASRLPDGRSQRPVGCLQSVTLTASVASLFIAFHLTIVVAFHTDGKVPIVVRDHADWKLSTVVWDTFVLRQARRFSERIVEQHLPPLLRTTCGLEDNLVSNGALC